MSVEEREHEGRGQKLLFLCPIAKALSTLPNDEKKRLQKKFDIEYFVGREKLSFHKYPQICEPEAKYGVNLGTTYRTKTAGRAIIHFAAEAQRQELLENLQKAKFFFPTTR